MSASVRPQRRRLAAVCAGTALLALAVTSCGFDDGSAVGLVTYTAEPAAAEGHGAEEAATGHGEEATQDGQGGHGAEAEGTTVRDPRLKGCHSLTGGAHRVENHTMTDMLVYVGADCTGESKHIGSKLTGDLPPQAAAWNSYRFAQ